MLPHPLFGMRKCSVLPAFPSGAPPSLLQLFPVRKDPQLGFALVEPSFPLKIPRFASNLEGIQARGPSLAAHHEIIITFQKHFQNFFFQKVADIRPPPVPIHHFQPSLTMLKHHACAHAASGCSAGLSSYLEYANFRANFGVMFSLGEILLRF